MRFLKKYNQLIKESENESFDIIKLIDDKSYIELNKDQYEEININILSFKDEDINHIKNLFEKAEINCSVKKAEDKYVNKAIYCLIKFNYIEDAFRDSLEIYRYENDYFSIKMEFGEIGGSSGNSSFFFCDDIQGLTSFLKNEMWLYSENINFINNFLSKKSSIRKIKDLLINNETGNDYYNYFLLFYKNPKFFEQLIKKLIEIENQPLLDTIKEYNLHNISNLYFLLEKNMITIEDIHKLYPTQTHISNNQLYLIFDGDIADLDFIFDKESRHYLEKIEDFDDYFSSYEKFEHLYFHDLTDKAEKAIIDKIEEIKKNMDSYELEELSEYDSWEEQVENLDSLEDVSNAILRAYNDAQRDADSNQRYEATIKPILNLFNAKEIEWFDGKIIYKPQISWLLLFDTVSDSRQYSFNGKYNAKPMLGKYVLSELFEDSNYLVTIKELLEVDVPYHGWDGDIDKEVLEDYIINALNEF